MVYVCPILHPAYLLRGNMHLEPAQIRYLRDRVRPLIDDDLDVPDMTQPPPGAILDPTYDELIEWGKGIRAMGVTVDIEAAGPFPICIRVRKKGGGQWHNEDELRRQIEWVASLLSDPHIPKIFHNGQAYDVPELEELGFEVDGYEDDTMLKAHVCYPEFPKGLEWNTVLFSEQPMAVWKYLTKEEDEPGEGK